MAHSLEARVPFLDYRLVELLFSLDARPADRARPDEGRAPARARRPAAARRPRPRRQARLRHARRRAGCAAPLGDLAADVFASRSFAERGWVDAQRRAARGSTATAAASSRPASSSGARSTSSSGPGRSWATASPVPTSPFPGGADACGRYSPAPMNRSLLDILGDPVSGGQLRLEAGRPARTKTWSTACSSATAGATRSPDGDPALRRDRGRRPGQTQASFGFKWTKRDSFGSEGMQAELHRWLIERYGFDVGGGHAGLVRRPPAHARRRLRRRLRHVCVDDRRTGTRDGAEWVGVDISAAIDVARERLGALPGHPLRPGRRARSSRSGRRPSTRSSRRACSTTRRRPSARSKAPRAASSRRAAS